MVQPTYQNLLNERDICRKRIRELEEENTRLRKRLGKKYYAETVCNEHFITSGEG